MPDPDGIRVADARYLRLLEAIEALVAEMRANAEKTWRAGWWADRLAALLATLGDINGDVQEALADERTRLNEHGYPEDLPLPALWWNPGRSEKSAADKPLLVAVGA